MDWIRNLRGAAAIIVMTCALPSAVIAQDAAGPVVAEAPVSPVPAISPAPVAAAPARIVIYRTSAFTLGGRQATFKFDKVKVGSLYGKQYLVFEAPPGNHVLSQNWSFDLDPFGIQVINLPQDLKPGRTYYFQFATGVPCNCGGTGGLALSWRFMPIDEATARRETLGFKPKRAVNLDKIASGD